MTITIREAAATPLDWCHRCSAVVPVTYTDRSGSTWLGCGHRSETP